MAKRGAGEKAAIALARELPADIVLMDDKKAIQEARKRGLRPVRMLTILDAAAERGFVEDLPAALDHLEQMNPFLREQGMQTSHQGHETARP